MNIKQHNKADNSASELTSEVRKALEMEVAEKREPLLPDTKALVKNWCFHNTKKLLQKYRTAKMTISATLQELENDCLGELGGQFDSMAQFAKYLDVDLSGTYLASRMRMMEQNRQMLLLIDQAIRSMRTYDKNGDEYYWILYFKYLSPAEDICSTDPEIVTRLKNKNIPSSISSFYRHHNAAIQMLSDLLWGYTARDTIELAEVINTLENRKKPRKNKGETV